MNDEHYGSLAEMTKAADLVVVGTVLRVRQDESRHTDLSPSDGAFAQLDFAPATILSGAPQLTEDGTLNVEFFMTDPTQLARFLAGAPDGQVMLFLRNKATEALQNGWPKEGPDTGHLYYRVVSDQGVVQEVGGNAVVPDDGGGFLAAINKQTFEDVIKAVQAVR